MIELYKRYTLITPQGQLSLSGIFLVKQFIEKSGLPALPEDWQWTWQVERGEYRGKFTTRAAAYWRKEHDVKVDQSVLTELGNIARAHTETSATYTFEFVNRLDWNRGDFGDPNSCLWTMYANGRMSMQDNGVWAVRFYDEQGKGYARAWFYVVTDWYIVWNGYGLMTQVIARVVSQFLSLNYKQIDLSNYGEDAGAVYINGGTGYAIGTWEALDDMWEYDFEFYVEDVDTCNHCGRTLNEDNTYRGADDEYYCDDCFYRFFQDCWHCGDAYEIGTLERIESDGNYVCTYCRDRYYRECFSCGQLHYRYSTYPFEGRIYCHDCADNLRPIYQE